MEQAALRGRPLDHPDTQVTLLLSMPLPGLAPTIISEAVPTPNSNAGRQAAARAALLAAAQQLIEGGQKLVSVQDLATHAGVSVVTVRAHWQALVGRLHLHSITQRRVVQLPNGGKRSYARAVLKKRGRVVPNRQTGAAGSRGGTDQARSMPSLTRLICPSKGRSRPAQQRSVTGRRRRSWRPLGPSARTAAPPSAPVSDGGQQRE